MAGEFHGGWLDLSESEPVSITRFVASASTSPSGSANVINSSNFYLPTGTWINSPCILYVIPNLMPRIVPIDTSSNSDPTLAQAMMEQSLIANLNVPFPLRNLIFVPGNFKNKLRWQIELQINMGGWNYNSLQLGLLDNAATSGDAHGKIKVFDFGSGPWTGTINMFLVFWNHFGEVNLALRANNTSNNTSLFHIRAIVWPVLSGSLDDTQLKDFFEMYNEMNVDNLINFINQKYGGDNKIFTPPPPPVPPGDGGSPHV
jgi:hypothetical protein